MPSFRNSMSAEFACPLMAYVRPCALVMSLYLAASQTAFAEGDATGATIAIVDGSGQPLDRAVVTIAGRGIVIENGEAVLLIDQVQKRFVPDVIAINKGDYVRFPNSDDIRHHVFSFSVPLTFELPLYSGEPREPIHFQEAGLVTVGCNIHDRMKGYIYVIDGALHRVTTGGRVDFGDLPDGEVIVTVYHPDAATEPALQFTTTGAELEAGPHEYAVDVKPATAPDTSQMSELERKFFELRHSH